MSLGPPRNNLQWVALVFGASLAAGGMLHFVRHAMYNLTTPLGLHDSYPLVMVVMGAGIAFNREIVNLIRAWRGGKEAP